MTSPRVTKVTLNDGPTAHAKLTVNLDGYQSLRIWKHDPEADELVNITLDDGEIGELQDLLAEK